MEFGLFQQQTTNLVMTQELRQAIHLLQLSAVDLSSYIYEQSLDNPLLEVSERQKETEKLQRDKDDSFSFSSQYVKREDQSSPIDYAHISRTSLSDYLLEQLQELNVTMEERKYLTYFIYSLREDGYLSVPLVEFCEELYLTEDEGAHLLEQLQQLDPAGVGARNLQECLLLQLQRLPERNSLAEQIIIHHMDDLAKRKWKDISVHLSVTMQEIQAVSDLLQTLDPRPGTRYSSDPIPFITPELSITRVGEHLQVHLVDHLLPHIQLNEHYDQLLSKETETEASEYARQKKQQVNWLIRSLEQRKQTIVKVGMAIVEHQRDYFMFNNGKLKPLTLKEIADEVGVHESTVSRATTNKYAETPRGLIELKSLFSSAVEADCGTRTSSQSIKEYIKELIEIEDKKKPFSDAKIVSWLQVEKGIIVSRRAIAKYRDELGIPSSTSRKRFD